MVEVDLVHDWHTERRMSKMIRITMVCTIVIIRARKMWRVVGGLESINLLRYMLLNVTELLGNILFLGFFIFQPKRTEKKKEKGRK